MPAERFWPHGGLVLALLLCGCGPLLGLDDDARLIGGDETVPMPCSAGCDDDNACTVDVCDGASWTCRHYPFADGPLGPTAQVAGDCHVLGCLDSKLVDQIDDTDVPTDPAGCALGSCSAGVPTQTPQPAGSECQDGQGGKVCNGKGGCVECLDDGDCTGFDRCGGGGEPNHCGCTPLGCVELGLSCGLVRDGCGKLLFCDNGELDGDESDIDCGGAVESCASRCAYGRLCELSSDCASTYCGGGTCSEPWSKGYGDPDVQHAFGVAVGADGSAVVVGELGGVVDFGGGPLAAPAGGSSMFVLKLSHAGHHVFSEVFGKSGATVATSVVVDGAGNIVVGGALHGSADFGLGPVTTTSSRAFVVKLDANGKPLWQRVWTDGTDEHDGTGKGASRTTDVAVGGSDRIVVTGSFQGPLVVGSDSFLGDEQGDVFVAWLDTAGKVTRASAFMAPGIQLPTAVACSTLGYVAVTGDFTGAVDFGGGAIASAGGLDVFVLELDAQGTHLFSKGFGDPGEQHAAGVAFDQGGNIYLGGEMYGVVDFGGGLRASAGKQDVFVTKLSGGGTHQWSQLYGDAQSQHAGRLVVDSRGDVRVVGSFQGAMTVGPKLLVSIGQYDVFAFKLDGGGGALFAVSFGNGATQVGRSIAATRFGSAVVVGDFRGGIDFGQGMIYSAGEEDVFVAALAP